MKKKIFQLCLCCVLLGMVCATGVNTANASKNYVIGGHTYESPKMKVKFQGKKVIISGQYGKSSSDKNVYDSIKKRGKITLTIADNCKAFGNGCSGSIFNYTSKSYGNKLFEKFYVKNGKVVKAYSPS